MVAQAQKMYHQISPETGEFIDFMIEHQLMDLKNRPGKASTGYMTELLDYQAPFVFSCFNHTIRRHPGTDSRTGPCICRLHGHAQPAPVPVLQ